MRRIKTVAGKIKADPFTAFLPGDYVQMMKDIMGGPYSKGLKLATNVYELAVHEPSQSHNTQLIDYSRLYESFLVYAGEKLAEVLDYEKDIDHPLQKKIVLSGIDRILESEDVPESSVRHSCWAVPRFSSKDKRKFSLRITPEAQLLYKGIGESMNDGIARVLAFYHDATYRHVKGWRDRRLYIVYQSFQDDIVLQLSDRLTSYIKKNCRHNPALLTDSMCSCVDAVVKKYSGKQGGA